MPTHEQLIQWLPGIALVACAAFPALFFLRQSLPVRLASASVTVLAVLLLFGALLGHQFHFASAEDAPVLVLGFLLGLLASMLARVVRSTLSRSAQ